MAELVYTPVDQIPGIVQSARQAFNSDKTRPLAWRKQQLRQIKKMMTENKEAINAALQADLHRPELECVIAEVRVEFLAPTRCITPHCSQLRSIFRLSCRSRQSWRKPLKPLTT